MVVLSALVAGTNVFTKNDTATTSTTPTASSTVGSTTPTTSSSASSASSSNSSSYKDGTYKATGSYSSPGGNEEIDVTITVSNGTITDTSVSPQAASRESLEYQQDFAATYKDSVVGKALATLQLGRISGSSLTNRGFNDALDQIRNHAKI